MTIKERLKILQNEINRIMAELQLLQAECPHPNITPDEVGIQVCDDCKFVQRTRID